MSNSLTKFRVRTNCRACERLYRKAIRRKDSRYYPTGRFTLKRKASEPVCPNCGSMDVVSVEARRKAELEKSPPCTCAAYPFRHRKGSLRFCESHPKMVFFEEPTEEELHHYQGCLDVPRTSEDSSAGMVSDGLPF